METSAYICIKEKERGRYEVSKASSFGSPDYTGFFLKKYFSSYEKALELIGMGYMRHLGETLDLSFFYHRDKKFKWEECSPEFFHDFYTLAKVIKEEGTIDYVYIFEEGGWDMYEVVEGSLQKLMDFQ